jgi:hypothetical protein
MTKAQREAINPAAEGLLVYQTDAPRGFWYYDLPTPLRGDNLPQVAGYLQAMQALLQVLTS